MSKDNVGIIELGSSQSLEGLENCEHVWIEQWSGVICMYCNRSECF